MSFLLDTNVVSETRHRRPDAQVIRWLTAQRDESLHLSVLVVGELRIGALSLARRDPAAGAALGAWIDEVEARFADRIAPVDRVVARRWAELNVPDRMPAVDGLLAATASVHGWTLVTRNVAYMAASGVETLNPFEAPRST